MGYILRWPSVAALLLAALVLSVPDFQGLEQGQGSEPWPDFRGGPANPGSRDIDLVEEGKDPRVEWEVLLSSGVSSSISINNMGLYVGTMNGSVYRLDPEDGGTIWRKETNGVLDATPLIADDGASLIVCTTDGKALKLSTSNGSVVWEWKSPSGSRIFSSPKEMDGLVYFGSYDSMFYCLHGSNGTLKWTYVGCQGYVHTTPALTSVSGKGAVLFGACDGTMNCLDSRTGRKVWTFTTEYIPSSPSVHDGKVYFGSYDSKVFCLDLASGEELWNTSMGGNVYSSPSVLGGRMAVGCNDGHLYMLDAGNGTVIWNVPVSEGALEGSPILFRDIVAVTSRDGLTLLHNANGTIYRSFELGDSSDSSPAFFDGTIAFGDSFGSVRTIGMAEVNGREDGDGRRDSWAVTAPLVGAASLLLLSTIAAIVIIITVARRRKGPVEKR